MNSYSKINKMLLPLLFLMLWNSLEGWAQQQPVRAQLFLNAPYSLYLEDYYTINTSGIQANLTLKDTYEEQREVYLSLRIESTTVKLETPLGFVPQTSIILYPNTVETLNGDQLSEYFQLSNLVVSGPQGARVASSGRLLEGFYNFSIKVIDKLSGQVLSNEAIASAWMQLSEPPMVTSPMNELLIDPQDPQTVQFSWQMTDMMPMGATGIEYKVWLYELTDETISNPALAISNSKALPIFESEPITLNNFTYDISMPDLERGKVYIYQIQAYDVGGRALFKNAGKSVVQWFRYGYPEGGIIEITKPENEASLPLKGKKSFIWSATDKRIENQPFNYKVTIVEVKGEQTAEEAVLNNPVWYSSQFPTMRSVNGHTWNFDEKLPGKEVKYAWKVECVSGAQLVAESEPQFFYGPPVMESFKIGGHEVKVVEVKNKDTNHFSGTGTLNVGENRFVEVEFNDLYMRDPAGIGRWFVQQGEIYYDIPEDSWMSEFELSPSEEERNGVSYFRADSLKLNPKGLYIKGKMDWPFPLANIGKFDGSIQTEKGWLIFNNFLPQGTLQFLTEENDLELLDPMNFGFRFRYPSVASILDKEKYKVSLFGDVLLPDNLDSETGGRIKVPFAGIKHPFSFDFVGELEKFRALNGSGFWIEPTSIHMDLSEQGSHGKFATDKLWKGIYIKKFKLHAFQRIDHKDRLRIDENIIVEKEDDDLTDAWVTGTGLHLKWEQFYNDIIYMHGFKGNLKHASLTVDKGLFKAGEVNGEILLPILSEEKQFSFTMNLSGSGFRNGAFDDLDQQVFTINKGLRETELHLTVHKPKFSGDDFVEMSLDIDWPELSAKIKNVGNFRIWSNYAIGFLALNGTGALTNVINTTFDTYPMSIEGVGVGTSEGVYAIGVTAKVVMGDDVSGKDGAPSVNIYSSTRSKYAPKVLGNTDIDYSIKSPELVIEEKKFEYEKAQKELESKLAEAKKTALEGIPQLPEIRGQIDVLGSLTEVQEEENLQQEKLGGVRALLNDQQREIFDEIVAAMVDELTNPITSKIDTVAGRLERNVNNKINKLVKSQTQKLNVHIESVVSKIGGEVSIVIENTSPVDISTDIEVIIKGVNRGIQAHVTNSLVDAVRENVQDSITHLAKTVFALRVNNKIRSLSHQVALSILNGAVDTKALEDSITQGVPNMLVDIGNDVLQMASPQNLGRMIEGLGNDAIGNMLDPDRLWNEIQNQLLVVVKDEGLNQLNNLATESISSIVPGDLQMDVPLNFSGFIASGDISDVVSLDSMPIHLESAALLLTGMVGYRPDDETYGTVFMGDITLIVREPEEFAIRGAYINGRKDGQSYWFAQLQTEDPDKKVGAPLSDKANPLKNPIKLGFVNIVAASGRVMKKMAIGDNGFPVPDFTKDMSAAIHFIVHDGNSSGGLMKLEVRGKYDVAANGDYVIEFEGAVAIKSSGGEPEPNESAFAYGRVEIRYNSAKKHFFGFAEASVKGPVCAYASLLVDTQPGRWRVAVGSLEKPVVFTPGCVAWGVRGFVDVDQETAEFGFGLQYSVYAYYSFGIGIADVGIEIDAGVAVDVFAKIRYKPHFALMRVGVQITAWAKIGVAVRKKWGSTSRFNLIDIKVQGLVYLEFEPAPTKMVGKVNGHVRICGIGAGFNAQVDMTIS